jgi:putative lipoic acid-binding regulatory protein
MALTKNSQIDLNGNEMILDADADTSITADTDDQIDIKVGGTDTVVITGGAMALKGATPTLTIGDAGAEDTKIVFDGNAQDFYIGLDDSADDLLIGLGSTVGTTPAISIDENLKATLSGDVEIGTTAPKINLKNTDTSIVADQSLGVIEVESSDGSTGSAGTIAKLDIVASGAFDGSGHGSDFSFITGATNQSGSIALSEVMRVTSTSRVGIGTTSPSQLLEISGSSDPRIRINNSSTALSAGTSIGGIEYQTNDASGEGTGVGASIEAIAEGSFGYRQQGVLLAFKTRNGGESATNTERMRITQQGNLLKNTTYDGFGAAQVIYATGTNPQATNLTLWSGGGSGIKFVQFVNSSGVQCGSITQNGTSAVTYGSGSDYRLKENVKSLENGLSKVQKLNPVQFDWKESGETNEGFIAHEVQEICKEAVSGQKDGEEMQGVDYGRITPLLVKAIQEQQEQIEALQSEINTLKGG